MYTVLIVDDNPLIRKGVITSYSIHYTKLYDGYKDAWPILNDVIPFVHEVLVRDPDI